MTRQDWLDWKSQPVSRMFYEAVDERIEEAKEVLANTAGHDPLQDSFYRGFVYAYREMIAFEVEDEEEVIH